MRHRVKKYLHFKKKDQDHRTAMLRNLVTSFFLHKSIVTTEKRARAILGLIDNMVNVVNTKDKMNAIRFVSQYLFTEASSKELFDNIAPKYTDRRSGIARITPIKYRDGDNAKLVKVELV